MAITSANAYVAAARQRIVINRTQNLTSATNSFQSVSTLAAAGNPGAGNLAIGNTTSGVVFDSTTAGAPSIKAFGSGATGYLQCATFRPDRICAATLYDRVYGLGAITSAVGTITFSSQPSFSSRAPDGNFGQFELWIEWATTPSAGSLIGTITYTDGAGTAGVVTPQFQATGNISAGAVTPLAMLSNGVQKVESITVTTASATGNFNILVVRRLAEFDIRVANAAQTLDWDSIGANEVSSSACLAVAVHQDGLAAATVAAFNLSLTIANG